MRRVSLLMAALMGAGNIATAADTSAAAKNFHVKVEPLLSKYCYDCHGNGVGKGKVAFDEFESDAGILAKRDLWLAALKNVRAGLMPPREEGDENSRPTEVEINTLAHWIKYEAFGTDPKNPDPGHVTARRLNRVEYRNTIRDLMGIDFNSEAEFPPDDSGNGFDNNGDVLTVSPLLLEKYLSAAEAIVDRAVPRVARVIRERTAVGRDFKSETGRGTGEQMSVRQATKVARTFTVEQADKYQVRIELEVRGSFDFDAGRAKLTCRIDGEERFVEEVVWQERKTLQREFDVEWQPGAHVVSFEIEPLAGSDAVLARTAEVTVAVAPVPGAPSRPEGAITSKPPAPGEVPGRPALGTRAGATRVDVRVASVQVRGPLSPKYWVAPENHERFFQDGAAPDDGVGRDRYAETVLRSFVTRAFRRPVDDATVKQLVGMARSVYAQPDKTFEEGIGRAMMAVLGSPRFLFRIEDAEPFKAGAPFAPIDQHALASRLSYFLWSTMPDAELFALAAKGELRSQLRAQMTRMLKDEKAQAFIRNFTGQWLQARDVEFVPINARVIVGPDAPSALRTREGRVDFDSTFRKFMRTETEMYFEHIIREDRSVLELVESDYTFLNEKLASFYGVPDVTGEQFRLVKLPSDSVRGGILTQGTILTVTSNPTRTSPVKRGLFILENILGIPPPPAPPNVPDLEEAKKEFAGREPKLSEMLAVHRANKLCKSCHERMDPLGLAMENFNALGGWRDTELGQPIDGSGQLITGEKFADVRELKRVLARDRKLDIYRCLTEKLLTYALGRGLDYYDAHTIDDIVEQLNRSEGRMSVLMTAVVESPAFQNRRTQPVAAQTVSLASPDRASPSQSHP